MIYITLECPDCNYNEDFIYDKKKNEIICERCGLVLYSNYDYVAGHKVNYPYKHIEPTIEDNGLTPLQLLVQSWREWLIVNAPAIYPKDWY